MGFIYDDKKNPGKNIFFHEIFELEGTGGKFQSDNQQVTQFLSLTSLCDTMYPRFTNVAQRRAFISAVVVLNIIFKNSTALKDNPWSQAHARDSIYVRRISRGWH